MSAKKDGNVWLRRLDALIAKSSEEKRLTWM